jgi:hypothetical protein
MIETATFDSLAREARPKCVESAQINEADYSSINIAKLGKWADDASRKEITEQLLKQALEIDRLEKLATTLMVRMSRKIIHLTSIGLLLSKRT